MMMTIIPIEIDSPAFIHGEVEIMDMTEKKMMLFLYHQMCNQSIVVRLKPPPEHSTKDLLSVW